MVKLGLILSFFLSNLLIDPLQAAPGSTSIICISTKCSSHLFQCAKKSSCLAAIGCMKSCSTNVDCQSRCFITHRTDRDFADLSGCIVEKKCATPHLPVKHLYPIDRVEIGLKEMVGDWFAVAGLNKGVDCWECIKHSINHNENNQFTNSLQIQVTLEGQITQINSTLTIKDTSIESQYDYFEEIGKDEWFVLYKSQDYLLVYYNGISGQGITYVGGFVLARQPGFIPSPEKLMMMRVLVDHPELDLEWKDMCNLEEKSTGCVY